VTTIAKLLREGGRWRPPTSPTGSGWAPARCAGSPPSSAPRGACAARKSTPRSARPCR